MEFLLVLRRFLWLITFMIYGHASALAECSRPLEVGWENWPPYQYVNQAGELSGLDVELLLITAKEAGCTIHFIELPWKRHLLQLESGDVDIAMGASYDSARALYAYYSEPIRQERVSLFVLERNSNKFQIKSLHDISAAKFKLGATLGYYYGEDYKKLMKQALFRSYVEELHTDQLNIIKLIRERLDGILIDPISIPHQLSTLQESKPLKRLFDVHNADIHLMFSKKAQDELIVHDFNQAIDYIKSTGDYDLIMDKYLGMKPTR